MTPPIVTARNLTVRFEGSVVLDAVSFDVAQGEWLVVIGPNGAGKTTLLRALAGLQRADGDVVVDGCTPASTRPRLIARHVGYVPQDPLFPVGMTVREYVLLGRHAHVPYFGVERRADFDVVDEVLAALDLEPFAARMLTTLSGGERQRVVLARAIAQQAPVLILDEPTTALDLGHQQAVLELIDAFRRQHKLTVVSAVHDVTLASQFADRLLLLARGRCIAVGAPRDVLTEERIAEHWGVEVRLLDEAGTLVVVPIRQHRLIEAVDG